MNQNAFVEQCLDFPGLPAGTTFAVRQHLGAVDQRGDRQRPDRDGYRPAGVPGPMISVRFLRIVAMASAVFAADAMCGDVTDYEIRCCFTTQDLRASFKNNFTIEMGGADHPIGHLRLVTPSGRTLGYDQKSGLFRSITIDGIYGLYLSDAMSMEEPEWHNSTPRRIVLSRLEEGEYRLEVIGQRDGRYALSFDPVGFEAVSYGKIFSQVPIKVGEVHVYSFPGKFANPRDGSIPRSHPNAFRVRRLEPQSKP